MDAQRAFWRAQLQGELPVLNLPTDFPRPTFRSHHGAEATVELPTELVNRLSEVGRGQDATLFMVLLAVYEIFLQRWTGQDNFIVGCPSANRALPELENVVGFFVNILPLRGTVDSAAVTSAAG